MMSEYEYEMWAPRPALFLCTVLTFQIKIINHYHFLCKLNMPRSIHRLGGGGEGGGREEDQINNQKKLKHFEIVFCGNLDLTIKVNNKPINKTPVLFCFLLT